jgi:opacity protein-like surface antigen
MSIKGSRILLRPEESCQGAGRTDSGNSGRRIYLNFIGSPVFDTFETTDTKFAWNIGAGVALPITEILLLELSYRYTDLGGAVWSTNTGAFEQTTNSLQANEFLLAARLQF